MSSANLPFHVRDMGLWHFRKACQEQHLDKHSAFVGKALLARGSCYVENVSELSEDEYPLVHNARMSGLTRCFAVFLHSVERDAADNDEYVLEFFLQLDDKDIRHVQDLVQTLKQIVESASGLELGEISPVEVTEPPGDASCLSLGVQLKQTRKLDASSSWRGLGHCLDMGSLTVKASFKDDMVKFRFPVLGGFADLENEVVQRINVKGKRVSLKYEDEDKDMLLVNCDADLQFMARNTTVKFIVEAYD
ncbi:hypothetical protein R6Q59_032656 [Mikania micrantha]